MPRIKSLLDRLTDAADQGYDTSRTWYHGTGKNFDEIDPEKLQSRDHGFIGTGFYITPEKRVAQSYANMTDPYENTVMELHTRANNPKRYTLKDKIELKEQADKSGDRKAFAQKLTDDAIAEGYDSAEVVDKNGDVIERVVFDPSMVRKTTADFDPDKNHLPNLTAAAAPVAVAGYGFASPDMAEASTKSALAPIADHPGEKYLRSRKDWDVGGYRDIPHGRLHRLANLIDKYDDTPFFDDAFGGVTDWMRGTAEVREEDSLEKAKRAGLAALDLL